MEKQVEDEAAVWLWEMSFTGTRDVFSGLCITQRIVDHFFIRYYIFIDSFQTFYATEEPDWVQKNKTAHTRLSVCHHAGHFLFFMIYDRAFTAVSVICIRLDTWVKITVTRLCLKSHDRSVGCPIIVAYVVLFSAPSPPTEENVNKR